MWPVFFVKIWFFWMGALHPFHASITEIRYNADKQNLEVSHRLFLNDIENTLNTRYHQELDLVKNLHSAKADSLIQLYIKEHFSMTQHGKPVDMHFLGYEREENAVWCYQEAKGFAKAPSLEIFNNILTETFDDQVNLVHGFVGDEETTLQFDKEDTQHTLDLSAL